MRRCLFHIFFCILSSTAFAQEQFVEKPAKFITRFPFKQLAGGVMVVRARINKIPDTLNFILDTGSGGISLDTATCVYFNIPHSPSGRTINGIAGIKEVDFARNNDLILPGLEVKNLDFYVNDYQILSDVYGMKIDGIIGYSFFSKYIVKFNFDSLFVEAFQQGSIRYPAGGYTLRPMFTALPIQPLRIKDSRTINANFYLDTGAGLCFLVSSDFNDDSSFISKKRKPVWVETQGFGGKKKMSSTIIKEVKLGPYIFRRVPTHIMVDEFNATSYPYIGGLIGNDILRRFNIIFNYQKREVHLLPNTHFREPFDYSYTGMNIYSIEGKIIIDDIVPGSPADKAGFMSQDIIIAVNSNFSNDINVYKTLLHLERQKVKVIIIRQGAPVVINFTVGRIF